MSDTPTDEDIDAARTLLRACMTALEMPTSHIPPEVSATILRLVLETAWRIKDRRELRVDYERARGTGATPNV